MHVLLVHPPVANVAQPCLGLPSLKAYLDRHGAAQVSILDANIAVTEELLTPVRLRKAYRWCYHRLAAGGSPQAPGHELHLDYLRQAVSMGDGVVDDIEIARRILTGDGFHDPSRYVWAVQTVLTAYLLLSARHFPTVLSHASLSMRYRLDSADELLASIRDGADNPFPELLEPVLARAVEAQGVPDVVGISVGYYEQLVPALTAARIVKRRWPSAHVTLGGTMISALHGKPLPPALFDVVDSLVFFEGERPLLQLLAALDGDGDLRAVPNLALRIDGEVVLTPLDEGGLPIDDLPTPDFAGLEDTTYLTPSPILPLAASRGCYWRRCTFCSRQHLQHTFRQRSPSAVVDDVETLAGRHGARHVFFVDECISPKMMGRIADELRRRSLDIRWSCYARFEAGLADPALCEALHASGLRMLYFGLESAHPRVLELMAKGTPVDTIARVLRSTSHAGIMNMVLYFVGFPTETREEALATMDFLLRHEPDVDFAIAGKFVLEEQSPIFRDPARFGVTRVEPLSADSDLGILYRHTTDAGMSDAEIDAMRERVNAGTRHLQSAEVLNRSHLLLLGRDYIHRSRHGMNR